MVLVGSVAPQKYLLVMTKRAMVTTAKIITTVVDSTAIWELFDFVVVGHSDLRLDLKECWLFAEDVTGGCLVRNNQKSVGRGIGCR